MNITYSVKNTPINLIADETAYGFHVVAELNDQYYYLGERLCNLHTAVQAYQEVNDVILTTEEFELVLLENAHFLSLSTNIISSLFQQITTKKQTLEERIRQDMINLLQLDGSRCIAKPTVR